MILFPTRPQVKKAGEPAYPICSARDLLEAILPGFRRKEGKPFKSMDGEAVFRLRQPINRVPLTKLLASKHDSSSVVIKSRPPTADWEWHKHMRTQERQDSRARTASTKLRRRNTDSDTLSFILPTGVKSQMIQTKPSVEESVQQTVNYSDTLIVAPSTTTPERLPIFENAVDPETLDENLFNDIMADHADTLKEETRERKKTLVDANKAKVLARQAMSLLSGSPQARRSSNEIPEEAMNVQSKKKGISISVPRKGAEIPAAPSSPLSDDGTVGSLAEDVRPIDVFSSEVWSAGRIELAAQGFMGQALDDLVFVKSQSQSGILFNSIYYIITSVVTELGWRLNSRVLKEVLRQPSHKAHMVHQDSTEVHREHAFVMEILKSYQEEEDQGFERTAGFSPREIKLLSDCFLPFARNDDGLPTVVLFELFSSIGWKPKSLDEQQRIVTMVKQVDFNGNGLIDFGEFLHLLKRVVDEFEDLRIKTEIASIYKSDIASYNYDSVDINNNKPASVRIIRRLFWIRDVERKGLLTLSQTRSLILTDLLKVNINDKQLISTDYVSDAARSVVKQDPLPIIPPQSEPISKTPTNSTTPWLAKTESLQPAISNSWLNRGGLTLGEVCQVISMLADNAAFPYRNELRKLFKMPSLDPSEIANSNSFRPSKAPSTNVNDELFAEKEGLESMVVYGLPYSSTDRCNDPSSQYASDNMAMSSLATIIIDIRKKLEKEDDDAYKQSLLEH